jgi:small-conductance mechanosensitive channel
MPVPEGLSRLPEMWALPSVDAVQSTLSWLASDGLLILVTILLAVLARWFLHRLIGRFVKTVTSRRAADAASSGAAGRVLATATGLDNARHSARVQTMASLLRSISTFVVGIIAGLTVLDIIGLPVAPLLASAGVGGLALGFGAQSLVKDFLSGIFMIFEDQYGVGDVVDTGEAIGTVEEVTLRVTRLRDADGITWYVRNGEIIRIGNRSKGYSTALVDMPISYREDVQRVLGILREASTEFGTDEEWSARLIEPPTVLGVDSITGQTVTVRVLAKCQPGENFGVQRELRQRLKTALDAAGVEAPPLPPFQPGSPV